MNNKLLKKLLGISLSVVMVGSMLMGCGSSTDTSDAGTDTSADGGTTESTVSASTGEEVEIVFSHFYVDGADSQLYDIVVPAIEAFNEDYDGVYEIVNEMMPQDSYTTAIATQLAADELPDMFMLKASQSVEYGGYGMLYDITDAIEESGLGDILVEDVTNEHTTNGSVYAIPTKLSYYGYIFYNTEIFAEVGIEEFPTTMDELYEACDILTDAGYIPFTLGDVDLWGADSILFSAYVNKYVGNDWTDSIVAKDGIASFTDQVFIDALTDFQTLADYSAFNENFTSLDNTEALQLYLTGEAAMKSGGEFDNSNIYNSSEEIAAATDIAYWPGSGVDEQAGNSVEQSATWGMAFSADCSDEQIAGAMEFLLNYFMTEENGQKMIEEKSLNPTWIVDEYDASLINDVAALAKEKSAAADNTCYNWDAVLSSNVKAEYQRGLQELLLYQTDPETLASTMQAAFELE